MGYLVRNFTCIPTFSGKFAAFHFAGTHCAVPNELAQTSERWIHLPDGRSGRSANPADGIGIDCKMSPIRKSLCDSLNTPILNPLAHCGTSLTKPPPNRAEAHFFLAGLTYFRFGRGASARTLRRRARPPPARRTSSAPARSQSRAKR